MNLKQKIKNWLEITTCDVKSASGNKTQFDINGVNLDTISKLEDYLGIEEKKVVVENVFFGDRIDFAYVKKSNKK